MTSNFDSTKFADEFCKEIMFKIKEIMDSELDLQSNIIDPFAAILSSLATGESFSEWQVRERERQLQKSVGQLVGSLHEIAIGCFENWTRPGKPNPDNVSFSERKLIEAKNRYLTVSAGDLSKKFDDLRRHLDDPRYNGFIAYYVTIIPDKYKSKKFRNLTYNEAWNISQRDPREDIRVIDGKSFYSMISGDPEFIDKLFMEHIPNAIKECEQFGEIVVNIDDFLSVFYDAYYRDFKDLSGKELEQLYYESPIEFGEEFEKEIFNNPPSGFILFCKDMREESTTPLTASQLGELWSECKAENREQSYKDRAETIKNNRLEQLERFRDKLAQEYSTYREYISQNLISE
ncbi:MAG: Eco47II family restriction endonuclease [Candidatus Thalassarchaeaceae archaeon]